jgi:UPF0755 protein
VSILRVFYFSLNAIVHSLIEIILVLTVIVSFYLNFSVKSKPVIFIPKGSTSSIVSYLDKKHYDLNILDTLVLQMMGYPQSGWINLKSTNMSKFDFLYKMTTSKAALQNITLIPGETYYFFLKEIASKLKISEIQLFKFYKKYAYKKDGNILAETYYLPIGMDEEDLILYLFDYTDIQYKKYSTKIFGLYNQKNWFKYITIASIIQKESASTQEMILVSSVIHNRINKKMKLQMDGTLNYGKFSHTKITPKMIRNDDSGYNTYEIKGIPSDPICAVEFNAIKAAIFPKNTDYLYFMKNINGDSHTFTNSYKRHKVAIKRVVKIKKEIKPILIKKPKINFIKTENKQKKDVKNLWKSVL